MKVSELFEARPTHTGRGQGAYYDPRYNEISKMLQGSVIDWMKKIGATKEDVAKAMAQVKASSLVQKDMQDAGLELDEKPASERRGTLNFRVRRKYVNTHSTPPKLNIYASSYQVHPNGQIRYMCHPDSNWITGQGKLISPNPKDSIVEGDPVRSIYNLMTAACTELLRKWKVSAERMDKKVAKFHEEE